MRKSFLLAGLLLCLGGVTMARAAFPADEIQILGGKEIAGLSDEQLMEDYIDVLVEMEAIKTFHATSGFMPKEYQRFKEVLKYRLLLLFEINKRKLELPPAVN